MTLLKVNGHLQHEIGSLVNSSWCYVYGQMLLHNINAHSNILKLLSLNKIKPNDVTIRSYLATNFPFRLKVRYSKRKVYALLDKVMSRNQWHIGVHQHHLMFKGHWRAPHETIYSHKKKVCLEKKPFPLGHFMLHIIMFLICQMTTKASNGIFYDLRKYVYWDFLPKPEEWLFTGNQNVNFDKMRPTCEIL